MDSNNKEPEVGLVQDMGIGEPPEPYRHLSKEALDESRVIAHNYLNSTLGSETRALGRVMTNLLNEIEELKIELAEARAKAQAKTNPDKMLVSRGAMFGLLQSILGPSHLIRELLVLYDLNRSGLGSQEDCLTTLINEYNSQINLPSSDETSTS